MLPTHPPDRDDPRALGYKRTANRNRVVETMLNAEGIRKAYPTRSGALDVLRGVWLRLERGQSAAIMGPSGCGKSTLLNILGTLEPPTSGRLTLNQADPFALAPPDLARFRNRRIGFVFQEHHLLPHLGVLENVLLPTLAHPSGEDLQPRARELLSRVGLTQRRDHLPSELSGGERQRAALARALIMEPTLVLADEPTGNLDRASAGAVADLLTELPAASGAILVVVTHSEALAARFGRVFDLNEGALVERERASSA